MSNFSKRHLHKTCLMLQYKWRKSNDFFSIRDKNTIHTGPDKAQVQGQHVGGRDDRLKQAYVN